MKLDVITFIITNIVLAGGAIWRISYILTSIRLEIVWLKEKIQIHDSAVSLRLSSLEGRVTTLESKSK